MMPLLALVLGSGGHTSELLKIISNLPSMSHLVIYSSADTLSLSKYASSMKSSASCCSSDPPEIVRIPRARSVGQSYLTSIFTTIYSLLFCISLFLKFHPKVVTIKGLIIIFYPNFRFFVMDRQSLLQSV